MAVTFVPHGKPDSVSLLLTSWEPGSSSTTVSDVWDVADASGGVRPALIWLRLRHRFETNTEGEPGAMKGNGNNPLATTPATVVDKTSENSDTFSLTLTLPPSERIAFRPGQFNMLGLPGFGEIPISFSSSPLQKNGITHTIRKAGIVTRALSRCNVGDRLSVRGPYGNGWPLQAADGKHLLMVAGGIGLAPLKPVIYTALNAREQFNDLVLLLGARNEEGVLFKPELAQWRESEKMGLLIALDEKSGEGFLDARTGLVTTLLDEVDIPLADAVTFTCGPEIMMRFVIKKLIASGQRPSDIFVSLERRMKCGIAHCGHCQVGPKYVCGDGPVFSYGEISTLADTLL